MQKRAEVKKRLSWDLCIPQPPVPRCKSAEVGSQLTKKRNLGRMGRSCSFLLVPSPLTCYANRLSSCPLSAYCTVASADLLSADCPTQVRDTVYWKRFCLYLVPLSFRRLKAWPPCCLTHHSLSPLTSLSSLAVLFPGDPHSLAAWPGWSSVRVGQRGSRQGYRLQPSCRPTGHGLPQSYCFALLSATVWCCMTSAHIIMATMIISPWDRFQKKDSARSRKLHCCSTSLHTPCLLHGSSSCGVSSINVQQEQCTI